VLARSRYSIVMSFVVFMLTAIPAVEGNAQDPDDGPPGEHCPENLSCTHEDNPCTGELKSESSVDITALELSWGPFYFYHDLWDLSEICLASCIYEVEDHDTGEVFDVMIEMDCHEN